MKGDECRPDAEDEALLFLRAAAAIDMSRGGGHEDEEDDDEDDAVGDGNLGEDGAKPEAAGPISSLPIQGKTGGAVLLASAADALHLSCEAGERRAPAGRLFTSSLADVVVAVGLKSGSSFTIGGKSSDWPAFTDSNVRGRADIEDDDDDEEADEVGA